LASDREDVREVLHVAQDVRAATRSLLHRGTPEQLAETQQLLAETRRALYLILAGRPQPGQGEDTPDVGAPAADEPADETADATMPPEID
jgi:hypothetical protein